MTTWSLSYIIKPSPMLHQCNTGVCHIHSLCYSLCYSLCICTSPTQGAHPVYASGTQVSISAIHVTQLGAVSYELSHQANGSYHTMPWTSA